MTTRSWSEEAAIVPGERDGPDQTPPHRPVVPAWWALAAPAAAILAGLAAEWLDFRALRYPILLMVGAGVLASALAWFGRSRGMRAFLLTVLLGVATWAAAETLYVVMHAVQGEAFETERFNAGWARALWLIGVHGFVLGLPTGIAAASVRQALARYALGRYAR